VIHCSQRFCSPTPAGPERKIDLPSQSLVGSVFPIVQKSNAIFRLNTINLKETFNKDKEGINPFRQPHFIILNLAIGGSAGGDLSKTQFPARYEIDYVLVYEKQ
jgi:hypothetical protein